MNINNCLDKFKLIANFDFIRIKKIYKKNFFLNFRLSNLIY